MSLKTFETYQLAVEFHRQVREVRFPAYLKDQVLRASSSIALNLAEGSGKESVKDQRRFYFIALGSFRECEAVLDLCPPAEPSIREFADRLGGCLYRLCRPRGG